MQCRRMICTEDEYTNDEGLEQNSDEEENIKSKLIFTRLTEMVRKHYYGYLEKQLWENVNAWRGAREEPQEDWLVAGNIDKCAKSLEDTAIKACMMSQIYQRHMVKIIAKVRRCTQERQLEALLQHLFQANEADKQVECKATQTDLEAPHKLLAPAAPETDCNSDDYTSLSLQRKIDLFQTQLNQKNAVKVAIIRKNSLPPKISKGPDHHTQRHKRKRRTVKPIETPITISRTPTPTITPLNLNALPQEVDVEQDDQIGRELARLFSEEKTELDEILGIDPNEEPDDPQISSILREIENARLPHELNNDAKVLISTPQPQALSIKVEFDAEPANCSSHINGGDRLNPIKNTSANALSAEKAPHRNVDLRNSLWPCELFVQRRRLTESLSRLIEEDFRWHELIKWRFTTLFGEDSDDEFAPCSPSIELDEVLIGSCIKRISPWMVKHLMKPMHDGLIANRYLFKKLAKQLAHGIVLENQYPDERIIKHAIEDFFCLHQAVMTAEDLNDIPNV